MSTQELLARLPKSLARSIQDLAVANGLSFQRAVFVAMRKLGYPSSVAYLTIRPHVKRQTAKSQGMYWNRALSHVIANVQVSEALAGLSDWVKVEAMRHGNLDQRLAAAKLTDQVLGRFSDTQVNVNVFGGAPEQGQLIDVDELA